MKRTSCGGRSFHRGKGAPLAANLAVHCFSGACAGSILAIDVNAWRGYFGVLLVCFFHVLFGFEPLADMLNCKGDACDGGMTSLAKERSGD